MTEEAIKAALGNYDVLWLTLWGEARGEPVEGLVAVGSVIRNRVQGPARFGGTYKDVCLAPRQFSCWNPGDDANHQRVMEQAERLVSDYAIRSTVAYDAATRQIQFIAQGIIGGQLVDNVGYSDHYLTTELFTTKPPTWAKGKTPAAVVGAHTFLKLG